MTSSPRHRRKMGRRPLATRGKEILPLATGEKGTSSPCNRREWEILTLQPVEIGRRALATGGNGTSSPCNRRDIGRRLHVTKHWTSSPCSGRNMGRPLATNGGPDVVACTQGTMRSDKKGTSKPSMSGPPCLYLKHYVLICKRGH